MAETRYPVGGIYSGSGSAALPARVGPGPAASLEGGGRVLNQESTPVFSSETGSM